MLLEKDSEWHSDPSILVELTNVLATSLRTGSLRFDQCEDVLEHAEILLESNLHTTPNRDVLSAAQTFRISAYDARYIALAQKLGVKLVTEDKKLCAAVPSLTQSLESALQERGN